MFFTTFSLPQATFHPTGHDLVSSLGGDHGLLCRFSFREEGKASHATGAGGAFCIMDFCRRQGALSKHLEEFET